MMLALEEWIAQSDDELEVWASVSVGFDSEKELAVKLEYIDYEEKGRNSLVFAFVSFDDAYELAKRLNVRLTALPSAINRRCGNTSTRLLPTQVEACFKEVLNFIVSCGVSYKLC